MKYPPPPDRVDEFKDKAKEIANRVCYDSTKRTRTEARPESSDNETDAN
jgi:hypothetical protein